MSSDLERARDKTKCHWLYPDKCENASAWKYECSFGIYFNSLCILLDEEIFCQSSWYNIMCISFVGAIEALLTRLSLLCTMNLFSNIQFVCIFRLECFRKTNIMTSCRKKNLYDWSKWQNKLTVRPPGFVSRAC